VIQLIPRATKRGVKRERTRVYVPAMGFVARRRGALLTTASGNVRTWTSEESARRVLGVEFAGEQIGVIES
jgi:hypothetical protein